MRPLVGAHRFSQVFVLMGSDVIKKLKPSEVELQS